MGDLNGPSSTTSKWYPANFFSTQKKQQQGQSTTTTTTTTTPYAIILLHQPINKNALDAILPSASMLVCADGAANRLYKIHRELDEQEEREQQQQNHNHNNDDQDHPFTNNASTLKSIPSLRLPDAIVGDLDSLDPTVQRYYSTRGVTILKDPDQYSTDFTKALRYCRDVWNQKTTQHHYESQTQPQQQNLDILAMGSLGGRVDQGFSQIHHLYMATKDETLLQGKLYLLTEQSLSFVLDGGINEIYVGEFDVNTKKTECFEENLGIIPVLGPARIGIRGVEWEVDDWLTEFGGQVSTSNHLRSDVVVVDAKDGQRLLFTLELARNLCLATGS